MRTLLFISFLFLSKINFAQLNPAPLLDSIKTKMNAVKDYTADINIKVDVDFIKIPSRDVKLYFKQPNKMKLKSTGFALLPKKGINVTMNEIFGQNFSPIYVKSEVYNNIKTEVVKVVPLDDLSDIVIATLWIDRVKQRIYKIEATSKTNGSFVVNFAFPNQKNPYDLPSLLTFNFDINKMALPMGLTGDFNSDKSKKETKKSSRATLTLAYSNYIVNKGIPENIFKGE